MVSKRLPAVAGNDHDDGHNHDDHQHDHPTGIGGALRSIFRPHSHDSADSVDGALEASARGIRAVKVSLLALGATAVVQLVIVVLTGSVALLADTIHNFSDALTAIPLWIAFVLVRRPANRRYTYGYGRFEDIAGLFIVLMIALSAVLAAFESIRRLVDPQPITYPWVVLTAGVIGFAGNEFVALYRIRVGRSIGSAALVADGLHARTDGLTSLAVALGAIGVLAGFPLADPIVGLLITVAILFVLKSATREVYRRLMDAVEPELVDTAEASLNSVGGVRGIETLRLRWVGHRIRAEAGLIVDRDLSVLAAHAITTAAHDQLLRDVPRLVGVTVHLSPSISDDADREALHAHQAPTDG